MGDLSELAARKRYGNYALLREEKLARISIGRSVGPMANSSCMFGTFSHLSSQLKSCAPSISFIDGRFLLTGVNRFCQDVEGSKDIGKKVGE